MRLLALVVACCSLELVAGLAPGGSDVRPLHARGARAVLSISSSNAARDLLYKDQMRSMAARALLEKDLLEGKNQSPMVEPKWSKKREKASLAGRGFGGGQAKLGAEVHSHAATLATAATTLAAAAAAAAAAIAAATLTPHPHRARRSSSLCERGRSKRRGSCTSR